MANVFDTGIQMSAGFSYAGKGPLDTKFIADTIADRDLNVTKNRAYDGMLVYVKETKTTYQYNSETGWDEFGSNSDAIQANVENSLTSTSTVKALSAAMGKKLNDNFVSHTGDKVSHITAGDRSKWDAKAENTVATQDANGLMAKEDKTKLNGIAEGANNYVHPASHPATMITQDATHKFVTDEEKASWNAKPTTKDDIGLANVTNDAQVKRSEMGVANGVATLDSNGTVPAAQLPSFVDDILEFDTYSKLPETGETGKIYVTKDTNKTYRWTGTQYIEISKSLALGEVSGSAYPGDKGKENADAIAGIKSGSVKVAKATNADTVNGLTVETAVPRDAKFTDTTYEKVTTTVDGLMAAADKVKLDTVEENANYYIHPNDASTRHVSDTQIKAWDAKASKDLASTSVNGLMSKDDKSKLDSIAPNANNYVHPDDTNTRHVTDAEKAKWNAKAENTVATISENGLMSATDKIKLNSIAEGANNYVHPNDSNTRHVTDAQIAKWDAKANTTTATQTVNGLMSAADKKKLDSANVKQIRDVLHTVTHAGWSAGAYTIAVDNITESSHVHIGLASNATKEQYEAAGLAKFYATLSANQVILKYHGTQPKVDIPVQIEVIDSFE